MQKYLCEPCGYIYDPAEGDPDSGIAPGTAFEDIPEDTPATSEDNSGESVDSSDAVFNEFLNN